MRKMAVVVTAVLLLASAVYAGSLAGVNLPDSAQVGGKNLVLNGMGLRTKFIVKVYVAGLYLPQKSSDANAIIQADEPKRLVMHFVHDVSKKQLTDAFQESFDDNTPDAARQLKADIDRMFNALEPVKEGNEISFTYVPGQGTTMAINGQDKVTIAGPAFAKMMFSVWLGPKPPSSGLKKGILGQ